MKTTLKLFSLLFASFFILSACSKDDDPADNDLFIGTYEGSVGFSSPDEGESVGTTQGSVRVTKVGDNYSFNFSNGIPSLNNIEMRRNDNSTIVIGDGNFGTITVTASTLRILYNRDGETWTANCER